MTDEPRKPRILLFDIETSPILGYVWSPWGDNLVKMKDDSRLLSVAWKWLGEGGIQFARSRIDPTCDAEVDDFDVVKKLHELFDEADILVAHNANKFDVPRVRARFLWWGFEPPSPSKVVDTLVVARQRFAFTYNRLDDLCDTLGLGKKVKHSGIDLWLACLKDDPKAWRTMERYNKHDVRLLERLYLRLLPWNDSHPNMALISNRPDACPKCGKNQGFTIRGYRHNQVTVRVRYQCKACLGYVAGRAIQKRNVTHVV